jgi:hypothetical protein
MIAFAMCAWVVAPFLLQRDAFSCRDARDFNRGALQKSSKQALFEDPVNAQSKFGPAFAVCSLLPSWVPLRTVGKR